MVEIKITLTDEGTIRVEGPIDDKILSLGLLAMAQKVIQDREAQKIIKPRMQ